MVCLSVYFLIKPAVELIAALSPPDINNKQHNKLTRTAPGVYGHSLTITAGLQIGLTCCPSESAYIVHSVSTTISPYLRPTGPNALVLRFQAAGFLNSVCAVDGCHIAIVELHCKNPMAYHNRRQFYSVILSGLCDS